MRLPPLQALAALLLVATPALGADGGKAAASGGAGISSFAAGGGIIAPIGTQYVTIGSAASFGADVYVTQPALGPDLDLRFSGFYAPFSVKNIPGASANLGMIGFLGGAEFHAPGSQGRISPYFGLQIGAVYEFLSFPNANGSAQDATIAFGARAVPGIEFPFGGSVSLLLEVPALGVFGKSASLIAGGAGSLRFRL